MENAAKIKIALAGNPNCGKTTIFNNITGAKQHVGNYPGVTVEKKEGHRTFNGKDLLFVDLPGTYSLTARSLDEVVARNVIINEKPDIIVNVLDASNLERNLYLAAQLVELGRPMVIALNMMDIADRMGIKIDFKKLGQQLGAVVGDGRDADAQCALRLFKRHVVQEDVLTLPEHAFSDEYFVGGDAAQLRDQVLPGDEAGDRDRRAEKDVAEGAHVDVNARDGMRADQLAHEAGHGRARRHDDASGDGPAVVGIHTQGCQKFIAQAAEQSHAVFKLREVFVALHVRNR